MAPSDSLPANRRLSNHHDFLSVLIFLMDFEELLSIVGASACAIIPVPAGSPVEKPPGGGGVLRSNIGTDGVVGLTVGEVLRLRLNTYLTPYIHIDS